MINISNRITQVLIHRRANILSIVPVCSTTVSEAAVFKNKTSYYIGNLSNILCGRINKKPKHDVHFLIKKSQICLISRLIYSSKSRDRRSFLSNCYFTQFKIYLSQSYHIERTAFQEIQGLI